MSDFWQKCHGVFSQEHTPDPRKSAYLERSVLGLFFLLKDLAGRPIFLIGLAKSLFLLVFRAQDCLILSSFNLSLPREPLPGSVAHRITFGNVGRPMTEQKVDAPEAKGFE